MDTIAAVATTVGEAGIAIIRVSGDGAERAFEGFFRRRGRSDGIAGQLKANANRLDRTAGHGNVKANHLYYGDVEFIDESGARVRDSAMGVLMRAPHSYTREDVCEFHVHGGTVLVRGLLRALFRSGIRPAEPGEFTKRAFLNGRIDLAQAEAVMRILGAGSDAALRAGTRQLQGGVSRFVGELQRELTDILAGISALLDFPDEIDEAEAASDVCRRVSALRERIAGSIDERAGRVLEDGINVVLAGKPNVGKSSLMNALLDRERAIVTEIPGTTRDVLTETLQLNGVQVHLSDTAGQRDTADPVESIGVARARQATQTADVRLIVLDSAVPLDSEDADILRSVPRESSLVLLNKSDLPEVVTPGEITREYGLECMTVSATTQANVERVLDWLASATRAPELADSLLTAERHIACARAAIDALDDALAALDAHTPLDLASIDLAQANSCLSQITGLDASEAVIDRVFEQFCVGK